MSRLGLGFLLLLCTPSLSQEQDHTPDPIVDTWSITLADGNRIGYGHTVIRKSLEGNDIRLTATEDSSVIFRRFGQENRIRIEREDVSKPDGELLSFRYRMIPQTSAQKEIVGVRTTDGWKITTTEGEQVSEVVRQWETDVIAPSYVDRENLLPKLKADKTLTLATLLIEYQTPVRLSLLYKGVEETPLRDGKLQKLHRVESRVENIPALDMVRWLNDDGETVKLAQSVAGVDFVGYAVPESVAVEKIESADLDLAVRTLVKVPKIEDAHTRDRFTYRVKLRAADPTTILPSDDSQSVTKVTERTADVVVTAIPLPKSAQAGKTDKKFLAATHYLNCDDASVETHANRAAGDETDPARIAALMEKYVRKVIKQKNFSTALGTASQVARNLEGDCTEHAVLLAAMLRAKGIPSRVATGMVYVEGMQAFGGHMWTEARLGDRWVPLDATLGRGGIGIGHIKLGTSAFGDDEGDPSAHFLPLSAVIWNLTIELISNPNVETAEESPAGPQPVEK